MVQLRILTLFLTVFLMVLGSVYAQNKAFKSPEDLGLHIYTAIKNADKSGLLAITPAKEDLMLVDKRMALALGLDEAMIQSIETDIATRCAEKSEDAQKQMLFFVEQRLNSFRQILTTQEGVEWAATKFKGLKESDKDRFYGIDTEFLVKFSHKKKSFLLSYRAAQVERGWILLESNIGLSKME